MGFELFKKSTKSGVKSASEDIQFCCISHTGRVRSTNQDSYLMMPANGIWAVADGMGGHSSGEVAAAIGLTAFHHAVAAGENITDAIQKAHLEVKEQAAENIDQHGMGATIVAIQLKSDTYQVSWIGDSRAYLWRNQLKPLTKDHSYIQMLKDQGLIDEQAAKTHPYRNVITQSLGSQNSDFLQIDTRKGRWNQGDIFLLCSDGLTGEVSDNEIAAVLAKTLKLEQKAQMLVDAVLVNGAKDNITIILLTASA